MFALSMQMIFTTQNLALVLLATTPTAVSHSWVERLYVLGNNDSLCNPGFPRGNGMSASVVL
jgi:hypothetical protein